MKERSEFHPAFQKLIDRIPERGMYSPYAYVSWWPEGEDHAHHVPCGDGVENAFRDVGASLEDAGEELCSAVERCNPDRHKGHGRKHEVSYKDVFSHALEQLQTSWYDREHVYKRWQQWTHKKWGGHMPAAVMMPTEGEWKMIVPNEMAEPIMRDIHPAVAKELAEIIPMPTDENSLPAELGRHTKPRWSTKRKLRHLRKKQDLM